MRKKISMQASTSPASPPAMGERTAAAENAQPTVTGRSIFAVQTVASGIVVHTGLLTTDNTLMAAPTMFTSLEYALNQIDDMRRLVVLHFSQAAQVGAQAIAAQAAPGAQAQHSAGAPTPAR